MKEKVFVSAIVYARNDEETAGGSLLLLDRVLYETFEHYEIVLVNDASQDATAERVREAAKSLKGSAIVINLSRHHGVEKAMMAGLTRSMGDFVFEFESMNFDFDPSLIGEMYRRAMKGSDIVVLTPEVGSSLTSKAFYRIVNRVTYLKLDLKTETARLVSRRALNAMLNLKEKVRYRKALYAYTGYAKTSIGYTPRPVAGSRGRLNRENVGTAFDIFVSFSNIGLKAAHYLSLVFLFFSVFMGIYALYNYAYNKSVVEGWTTLMILISFGFAGLFFIVGMLGEYISRILIELQDRPFYTTRSVDVYKPSAQPIDSYESGWKEAAAARENK